MRKQACSVRVFPNGCGDGPTTCCTSATRTSCPHGSGNGLLGTTVHASGFECFLQVWGWTGASPDVCPTHGVLPADAGMDRHAPVGGTDHDGVLCRHGAGTWTLMKHQHSWFMRRPSQARHPANPCGVLVRLIATAHPGWTSDLNLLARLYDRPWLECYRDGETTLLPRGVGSRVDTGHVFHPAVSNAVVGSAG